MRKFKYARAEDGFGKVLREQMMQRGYTYKDIVEMLDVSYDTVRSWLAGTDDPHFREMPKQPFELLMYKISFPSKTERMIARKRKRTADRET